MKSKQKNQLLNRRDFVKMAGIGVGTSMLGFQHVYGNRYTADPPPVIQGFEDTGSEEVVGKTWKPVSNRKVRVGLIGYGVCKFASAFGFQDHPNVEVVAVSDLIPERCAELAKVTNCKKTYPSFEALIKDDEIEAVFIATDAPSHAKHSIDALNHGKHVACAVPAVWGSLDDAYRLHETVKRTGLKYMMFETSMFHEDLYAMRQLYKAGILGEIVYSEGEYYHYFGTPLDSFNGWRVGLPPQFYPTHANAYHLCVTEESFTEVSCLGLPSVVDHLKPKNNQYNNPFGTEVAMFRSSLGGMSRMVESWDTPGFGAEAGRIRGTKGSFYNRYEGLENDLPDISRPSLPNSVDAGGHGGSHGRLTDEFITAILLDRKPLIDIHMALNLTVAGIVAHQSALKNGEWMKIPQFKA
ncbi:MAG: Gfo/Idh/MocA family oxidoreductase [Proteiniphilum sp.]|jgi:predicted dehydrogenase|nr:Gfo/Idh/MocA family oxidoreductase [Proteiniphilum sp.]MDD3076601.1 Gfo/Idh/MocA family oxidoreductase [Proteiniphilum sp.]MDD3779385.1 Gfo/Idh/MocA family oxidoreductase [Proteiniphilum sp.]MDD3957179.1 Gfo/Idh/MocA family oxidoreductase [Proteiniphilum sp.]MDD4452172.1 Gfo/Idh/MocA family oxidoreductase [Proteiniphilum sp.]